MNSVKEREKLIKDVVKKEVDNVRKIIMDLLRAKVGSLGPKQPDSSQQIKRIDAGTVYNDIIKGLDNLKQELTIAPSSETVRQIKALLAYAGNAFPSLTNAEVRACLQKIHNFIPYVYVHVNEKSRTTLNLAKSKDKQIEIRRVIREIILKFLKDNLIVFLNI